VGNLCESPGGCRSAFRRMTAKHMFSSSGPKVSLRTCKHPLPRSPLMLWGKTSDILHGSNVCRGQDRGAVFLCSGMTGLEKTWSAAI
jgi:hypothetical protein